MDFFDADAKDPEKLKEIIEDMKALTPTQLSNIANIVKDLKNSNHITARLPFSR